MIHAIHTLCSTGKRLSLRVRIGSNYAFATWHLDDEIIDSRVLSIQGAREAWRKFQTVKREQARVYRAGNADFELTAPEKY